MQPVAELPRLAFESDSVATSRSLSPRTTLPAANELFWLSVDAVNADHVLDPAIVPPAATTSSDSASLCLAATGFLHGLRLELEHDVLDAAAVAVAGALRHLEPHVELEPLA